MYYLILLTTFVLSNINSFSTNFFQYNSEFLNSKIKKIEFDYLLNDALQFEYANNGTANLIITDTCYKISIISPKYNHVISSNSKIQTSYNPESNQIFIENANFKFDSLILNFFDEPEIYFNKYFAVDTLLPNIIESIYDNSKVTIFTNNYAIDSVIIIPDQGQIATLKLFNIKLSEYDNNNFKMPFKINKPNAFILDLGD